MASGSRSPVQTFSLIFGVLYLIIGLAGLALTGFDDFFAGPVDARLIIFGVNPMHNIVHIAIGIAWLAASRHHATAKNVTLAIGAAYGLVTVLGAAGLLKFLSIDSLADPDNFLHLASSAISLYFATAGAEQTTPGI
jgi:hypothetical protein